MGTYLIKEQNAERNNMYSKPILKRYIAEKLKLKDWSYLRLATELGIAHSNLTRALESEKHNLTLEQFSVLVTALELTPEQVFYILTGKRKKEATLQLIHSYTQKVVDEFLK